MEVIITHVSADFDALASMVAASKLYPNARMAFPGSPDQSVRDFMALHKDVFQVEQAKDLLKWHIHRLIIVDARLPSRLGEFRDLVNDPMVELHVFDHHPPTHEAIVGDMDVIEPLGATTTVILRKVREKNLKITPLEATLFALGIYEETGFFSYTTTTREDLDTAAWLLSLGANLSVVTSFVHHSLNEDQRSLLNDLILSSKAYRIKGFQVLLAKAETMKYVDELALVTHRIMDLQRMDAVFSFVKMRDRVYIVGRSIQSGIDVSAILSHFGGGGHPTAASASVRNMGVEEVESQILSLLNSTVRPLAQARDLMSSPVRYIDTKDAPSIEEVQKLMLKYGHSGLPVVENDRPVGIISRRDVDKALHHGYDKAPVNAYMSKPVICVDANSPASEVQRIMIEQDIGRVPILDGGKMVGIITRSDIIRSLHGEEVLPIPHGQRRTLDHLRQLPQFLQSILETAGKVGDDLGFSVYVVGGFLRDLLLGVENLDVDIVVEGDGITYAERLAQALGGRAKSYEKFGTAVVILSDGFRIDVATSRTEFYTRPAALPKVMGSSVKQDLYRRDFTINAMAVKLNSREFGDLIDFFGSQRDLCSGIVRVLHNLSFIEDPTRIFRAVKFEQRYHFKMDQQTERLLAEAVAQDVFRGVAPERIRDEIIQILSEARPMPAIKRMEKLKILRVLHPGITVDTKVTDLLEEITATLVQFQSLLEKEKVEKWLIYFLALLSRLPLDQIKKIAEHYKIPARQVRKLALDTQSYSSSMRILSSRNATPGQICMILEPLSLEALIYLLARTRMRSVKQKIAQFLTRWRDLSPLVRGRDLVSWGYAPGPDFHRMLRALRRAQLDGLIKDREEARLYLLKNFSIPEEGNA